MKKGKYPIGPTSKGNIAIKIRDGILAQQKLDGDPDVYGSDDPEELKALVAIGKDAESRAIALGVPECIASAKNSLK